MTKTSVLSEKNVPLLTYFSSMTALRIAVVRPYLLATFLQLLPSVLFCFKGMRGFQSSAPLNHVSRLDVSRKTKKHTVWTIKCDTFSTSCSSFLGSKELVKVQCLKSKYSKRRSFCSRVHVPLAKAETYSNGPKMKRNA